MLVDYGCQTIRVQERRGDLQKSLLPVEQVVSGYHAQEACWIRDWVKLVVELLKLLVQQISGLALCLAARTPPERKRGMEWEPCTATETLARKKHFSKVDNTQTYIVSLRINQLHTLLICPKHTLLNPHTLGLISQTRSNTLMESRVKSFHYNAGDVDPVSRELTTPTPHSRPRHHSPPSPPSCLNFSDAPILCNSCVSFLLSQYLSVNLHHGIYHRLMLPPPAPPSFWNLCIKRLSWDSLSWAAHTDRAMWTEAMLDAECSAVLKDHTTKKYILTHRFPLSQGCSPMPLNHPFFYTHMLSPFFSVPFFFPPLISECCLPFLSTLEDEWAGKWCHIVPIQAQWRVRSFPLE